MSTPTDAGIEQFGYKQQFDRTLKSFSSFAVGFSFISISCGIFTTSTGAIIMAPESEAIR